MQLRQCQVRQAAAADQRRRVLQHREAERDARLAKARAARQVYLTARREAAEVITQLFAAALVSALSMVGCMQYVALSSLNVASTVQAHASIHVLLNQFAPYCMSTYVESIEVAQYAKLLYTVAATGESNGNKAAACRSSATAAA
jgi:hypothetical protein